jgi:tetratricopeptide (TPR) repeat protein
MNETYEISGELEWRGYGNFALFKDTGAKIARHKAQLAELPHADDTLVARARHTYALASLYWARHENDESLAYLQRALGLAERLQDRRLQSWCCNGLGDVYADMGRHDDAIAAYQRALFFDATSAYSYLSLGGEYGWFLGDHKGAIAAYERALELGGLDAHLVSIVHNGLGEEHRALGDEEAAIAAYQRAIEADPGFLSPHNNLGSIYMKRHAFPEARHHFEERIRLRPQHSLGAYVSLGIMARHEGDPAAEACFRRALESFEAAWQARYDTPAGFLEKKALALIGLGHRVEALQTLREMLAQREPGDEIELYRYELLRTAPCPPDGIDEMIALLSPPCEGSARARW